MLFLEYMDTYRPLGGITVKECRIAGIAYPLESGWRKQGNHISLSEAQVAKMLTGISEKYQARVEYSLCKQALQESTGSSCTPSKVVSATRLATKTDKPAKGPYDQFKGYFTYPQDGVVIDASIESVPW